MRQELGFKQRYVSLPQRAWLRHKDSDLRTGAEDEGAPPRVIAATIGAGMGAMGGGMPASMSSSSKESWWTAGSERSD